MSNHHHEVQNVKAAGGVSALQSPAAAAAPGHFRFLHRMPEQILANGICRYLNSNDVLQIFGACSNLAKAKNLHQYFCHTHGLSLMLPSAELLQQELEDDQWPTNNVDDENNGNNNDVPLPAYMRTMATFIQHRDNGNGNSCRRNKDDNDETEETTRALKTQAIADTNDDLYRQLTCRQCRHEGRRVPCDNHSDHSRIGGGRGDVLLYEPVISCPTCHTTCRLCQNCIRSQCCCVAAAVHDKMCVVGTECPSCVAARKQRHQQQQNYNSNRTHHHSPQHTGRGLIQCSFCSPRGGGIACHEECAEVVCSDCHVNGSCVDERQLYGPLLQQDYNPMAYVYLGYGTLQPNMIHCQECSALVCGDCCHMVSLDYSYGVAAMCAPCEAAYRAAAAIAAIVVAAPPAIAYHEDDDGDDNAAATGV